MAEPPRTRDLEPLQGAGAGTAADGAAAPRKRARVEAPSCAGVAARPAEYALPASISYARVAEKFPELRQHLMAGAGERSTIDFGSPDAVRVLNRALLRVYFDLDVHLPSDSLCPTVASRLNYLEWIRDNVVAELPPDRRLAGIDIGTGASCIYPLLGVRAMPQCTFVGTDINSDSIAAARANVCRNSLEKIGLFFNVDRSIKLPLDVPGFPLPPTDADGASFAFCMCNPPFYRDESERRQLARMKALPPGLDTRGKDDELYTAGGEEEFLAGLVDESAVLGKRIRWYTTMTGKKATLAALAARVRAAQAKRIREGRLVQGKTTRWVLAWSFFEQTRFCLALRHRSPAEAMRWFEEAAAELDIQVRDVESTAAPGSAAGRAVRLCALAEKTWTRQWRRQRKLGGKTATDPVRDSSGSDSSNVAPREPVLEFCVVVDGNGGGESVASRVSLFLSPGYESSCLLSLHGHLSRRLSSTAAPGEGVSTSGIANCRLGAGE